MIQTLCTVDAITPLTPFVQKVLLSPQQAVDFLPGQYLQLCLTEQDKRPFSLACLPDGKQLELHIGASKADDYSSQALNYLQQQMDAKQPVMVEAGLGQAHLRPSDNPVLLLAGGTGFSYVYSMAKALQQLKQDKPVFLYWGVRQQSSLYLLDELQAWASSHSKFRFIPVVQDADDNWQGRSGLVHEAVLNDFVSLDAYDIYIAGPFPMVGVARDAFLKQGAHQQQMFADAFAYI
ncbi:NAD(P)H-flavin reductase [Alkalimonas amylolytica]|uniref:Aquacobalamin reductase / NAD(P)H-flavin reductase n=1 Tax=Alkalimonas amylolytica TaxID=152573 RepID=A0A1H4EH75_ALKAM|nr:NAD(P)H-flavin reductase [Alkalimonas amylolytica]SEA84276.1 aquacobalamin reductase / NAD(P)H-flavin reductase [Alkalimonas amylolytica]